MEKITEEDKGKFKELFEDYLDLEDQKAQIRDAQNDLKDEMSAILSEGKGIVAKVISYLIKQRKKGEDELGRIYELVEDLDR